MKSKSSVTTRFDYSISAFRRRSYYFLPTVITGDMMKFECHLFHVEENNKKSSYPKNLGIINIKQSRGVL